MYQFCYKQDYLHIIVFIFFAGPLPEKIIKFNVFRLLHLCHPVAPLLLNACHTAGPCGPSPATQCIDAMRKSQSRKEHN